MTGKKPHRKAGSRPAGHGRRHIADAPITEADALGATVQSPTTESGLPTPLAKAGR